MLIRPSSAADHGAQAEKCAFSSNGATQVEDRPIPRSPNKDRLESTTIDGASLAADPVLIRHFLAESLGGDIHLFAVKPDADPNDRNSRAGKCFGSDADAAADWAIACNSKGWNVWWTVNQVHSHFRGWKPAKTDIKAARFVHLDLDPPKSGLPWDKVAAVAALMALRLPPSFIIDTGNGLGAFWRLEDSVDNHVVVEAVNTAIRDMFDADACQNIDRVMGLPGTVNYPGEVKRGRGAVPVMRGWAERDDGAFYQFHDLALAFALVNGGPSESDSVPSQRVSVALSKSVILLTADDLGLETLSPIRSVIDYPAGLDRSRDALRCAGDMHRAGFSGEQIAGVLLNPANAVSAHCLSLPAPHRAAVRILEKVVKKADQSDAIEAYLIDGDAISFGDLEAILPEHKYVYTPTGALWPAASVNGHMPSQFRVDRDGNVIVDDKGKPKMMPASEWLDKNKPCTQVTWCPGMPQIVEGMLFQDGAWVTRAGERVYNEYRPAPAYSGDAALAQPFIDHVFRVYPEEAGHILQWAAHRVQKPQLKVNHALVLGGGQGIGKDTILAPIVRALGEWNCAEVSPAMILGRFNGFAKSVLLRVSEASDLGDSDRFAFYEHLKTLIAAPPDSIRVDQKHRQEYMIPNVCGVVITTNHKTDGIHLEPDDRRHFVCWSDVEAADLGPVYFKKLYGWLDDGGYGHVAAYLHQCDVSQFDPKSPPPKTTAFWAIVDAGRNPDDAQMRDVVEHLRDPLALTIADAITAARELQAHDFADYLGDRKNARKLSFRFEGAGYVRVTNDDAKDGCFKVNGRRTPVYAQKQLTTRERIAAALSL